MFAIADVSIVPIGVGTSLSRYVAECEKVFQEFGLNPQLHAYGTNVEGPWDQVMAAIKECHKRLHAMGVPRVSTNIRIGTRTDREQRARDKVASVRAKLNVSG